MSDKSNPWADASKRGRGTAIKVTAVVLLAVAFMWTYLYTQSLKTTDVDAHSSAMDPVRATK